jgi:mono/diheme cytochrome c family protein
VLNLSKKEKSMRVFFSRLPLAACLPLAVAISACGQPPAQTATPAPAAAPAQSPVERGKVLVQVGGCHDCHTTKKLGPNGPEPDMDKMLSGHPEGIKITAPNKPPKGSPWTIATTDTLTAWSGAWGISFAANLTPDPTTGLRSGSWSEDLFIRAMRTGKHIGNGRDILPPMPWAMYSKLSDEDLKAIWAYLGSIPPIENDVPNPIPPAGAPAAAK